MSNESLFERASRLIPGGVNSPVRAFRAVGGVPRFFERASGAYLWDAEGRRYIDYVGSWGPMVAGHTHPAVVEAVQEAASRALSFGAPTAAETELAETLVRLLPSLERVRLVSSGTEATMTAIRLARGFTGRSLIVKFEGCYHGHADALLVKAGSGALTFGNPSSAGVPAETAAHTLVLDYNDMGQLDALFDWAEGRAPQPSARDVPVETVFFGGGTPTLLPPRDLTRVVATIDETDAPASRHLPMASIRGWVGSLALILRLRSSWPRRPMLSSTGT